MEPWHIPFLFAVGVAAGWINVMAGGGSMLTLPVMLFLGLPAPVANGTNRIAIIAQNVVAVASFFRRGISDLKLSIALSLAALPGAVIGALVGAQFDGPWFERLLALVMLGVLGVILGKKKAGASDATFESLSVARKAAGFALMFVAGLWGGFIQVGVGFIIIPILHRVFGLDLVKVNMHKVFVALCYSVVALAIFANQTDVAWSLGLALAAGNATGGWLGVRSNVKSGEALVKKVLVIVIVIFVAKLLLF